MLPTVSVIIPNYNHELFLEQRIESILNQTFQDFEIILLDDASTDASVKILNKYKEHSKISACFFNGKNSGSPFGVWEKGFELARGKYIWIAESDDWCEVNFLEKLVPLFEDSETVVTHCKSYNVNTFTNIVKENKWWDSFKDSLWSNNFRKDGTILLKKFGKYKCPVINVSSALIRKSSIEYSMIPSDYKYCGDWLFWAKIFNKGKVAFCSEPMNYIRIHSHSATSDNNSYNLDKIMENFKVAKQISFILGEKFVYHKNFNWLLNLLVKENLIKRNYLIKDYIFPSLQISFLVHFYEMLLTEFLRKLLNKKSNIFV